MSHPIDQFQDDLNNGLVESLAMSTKAAGFDVATYDAVMSLPRSGWEVLAPGFEGILRGVQEQLCGADLCRERKHFHRAWLRGAMIGLIRRGMSPDEAIVPLAHLSLLTAYDEAVMLPVFGYSFGWAAGQAMVAVGGSPRAWHAALERGLRLGLETLHKQGDVVPSIHVGDERVLSAARSGMKTAAMLARLKPHEAWD